MRDPRREVGAEDDVERAGHAHLAAHREPGRLGDAAAAAVGAVEVAGADVVLGAVVGAGAVPDGDRDPVVVDDVAQVLGRVADARAAGRSRRSPGPVP